MSGRFAVFGFDPAAVRALEHHAQRRGLTVGKLIEEILLAWLRRHPAPEDAP